MGRLLDRESAAVLMDLIRSQGIQVRAGVQIEGIVGENRVEGVKILDGTIYPAQLVLISCGVRANTDLAVSSGLNCGRGLLVDDELRTSDPDIYGAGDCIQWKSPNPSLWNYARASGTLAGTNAARSVQKGQAGALFSPKTETVILKSMGTWLFSGGNVDEGGAVVTEVLYGRPEAMETDRRPLFQVNFKETGPVRYKKKFYREGKLCGAVLIGDLSDMEPLKREMNGA